MNKRLDKKKQNKNPKNCTDTHTKTICSRDVQPAFQHAGAATDERDGRKGYVKGDEWVRN